MSKRRLAHLKKARLASVEYFKRKKLEREKHDTEHLCIDDDQAGAIDTHHADNPNDTVDMKEVENEGETRFWNEGASELESDMKDGRLF